MMIGHITLFGLAEIVLTVVVLAFVEKVTPKALDAVPEKTSFKPLYIFMAILIVLTPLGLLATGTAWGEWGADEIASLVSGGKALGYTPAGMQNGFELSTIFPDYSMAGLPDWIGYILSAFNVGGYCFVYISELNDIKIISEQQEKNIMIDIKNVCFAYDQEVALRYINLHIEEGESVIIQGPNGCGKSTLIKLLNGIIFPSEGTYTYKGKEITEKALKNNSFAKWFHQQIGYVFQNADSQLFCGSVEEEIIPKF